MSTRRERAGFTLIEVLVALAVFAILSALAYGTLNQTLASADILGDRMQRLKDIQRAVQQLDQDFMQLTPRPVRQELGESLKPALQTDILSGFSLELTRAGWNNPSRVPRGTLQRVAYRLEDDKLRRYYWSVLDRTLSNEPTVMTLLDGVQSIEFRFMLDNGAYSPQWPPENRPGPLGLRERPRAVEILLTLANQDEIRRLIEIVP
ncbi:MAG TPA: type II secretion system minor pseudopilin GspJ [Woeseiaceae bacterium]|nr:type II secretion system minor pseudopilin GspJ [Woeseiaceae bacterium]